jgi:chitinase
MKLEEKLHENVYMYSDVIENPQAIIDLINKLDSDERVHKVIPSWKNWNSSSRDGNIFGKKKDFNLSEVENLDEDMTKKLDELKSLYNDLTTKKFGNLFLAIQEE